VINTYFTFFLSLTTLFLPHFLLCQINLVPNASFEGNYLIPNDIGQGMRCITNWKIPVLIGTGDYYHKDSPSKKANTDKNTFGKQEPHSGNAYAGICITKKFREYLQIDLLQSLKKGKQYKITIWVSCGDKTGLGTVKEFGVLFSQKKFMIPNNEYMQSPPQVLFKNKNGYDDTKNWTELSLTYTANGDENVMTFGCFMYKETGVEYGEISGLAKYAHYYVDDISISEIESNIVKINPVIENKKQDSTSFKDFTVGKTYVFKSIEFEKGESTLLPKAFPELDNLIIYLRKNTNTKLLITGHTDNIGNPDNNLTLSYQRAKTIMLYLSSNGINENLISIDGKGDKFPISSNETEAGREKNRRVEISFL
jgi:outer membrane protein OmpA-like peptidoglycan-associated protein